MKKLSSFFSGVCVLCASVIAVSCSDNAKFVGLWKSVSPVDMTAQMPAVMKATSDFSVDFMLDQHKTGGPVALSADYKIVKLLDGDSLSGGQPYMLNIGATASVSGTWTYDVDDKDDLLLDFDMSTLKVSVDKENVTYTAGDGDLQLDSVTEASLGMWKKELITVFSSQLSRFTVIDDVEVKDNGTKLSFEVHSPEADLMFTRM